MPRKKKTPLDKIKLPHGFEINEINNGEQIVLMYREDACCGDSPKAVPCIAGITVNTPGEKIEALIAFGKYLESRYEELAISRVHDF